ncbi:MAG: RlmE family RNA methyltransferase [Proteobacteria bacterium]|nr:RlmE family RNA methyltransferase [Pseudomonadota bacterium]
MGKFVPKDTFFKKAKKDGYRARSAYKLKEALDKFHFIRKGDKVLDIGCAPGSFMQVISGIVGQEGMVIGIDILPLKPFQAHNTITVTCDIRDINIKELLGKHAMKHFDVITCDIAPNLTGIREVDNKNIEELYYAVYDIILEGLKRGGDAFLKSFFSDTFSDINLNLKKLFKKVTVFKPVASRTASSEIYLVCVDKKYGCVQQD